MNFSTLFILDELADVYLSFIYWSLFTSLCLPLWYFAVWALAMTGGEAFGLAISGVILLENRFIRNLAGRNLTILWLLAIVFGIGLSNDLVFGEFSLGLSPLSRMIFHAPGMVCTGMLTPFIWNQEGLFKYHSVAKWISGLILMVIVKFANSSLNPVHNFNQRCGQ